MIVSAKFASRRALHRSIGTQTKELLIDLLTYDKKLIIVSSQQVGYILVQRLNNAVNENLPLEKEWSLINALTLV